MSSRKRPDRITPICVECGGTPRQTSGAEIYPHRPDLRDRAIYVCPCGARVGAHPGTTIPLGHPCGPATARLRDRAHRVFDAIWLAKARATGKSRGACRGAAYRWLGRELGLKPEDTHIAHLDGPMAQRVIDLCAPIADRLAVAARRRHDASFEGKHHGPAETDRRIDDALR